MKHGIKSYVKSTNAARLSAAFILIATFTSCNNEHEDAETNYQTKSLDNFTSDSGKLEQNDCGIKLSAARLAALSAADKKKLTHIIAPTADLKRQVAGALVAVPKPLQRLFFSAKGRIRISADASTLCSQVELGSTDKQAMAETSAALAVDLSKAMKSCWKADGGLEIIIKDDPAEIQHNLLRMFALLYTDFLTTKLQHTENLSAEVKSVVAHGTQRLQLQKQLIGAALLQDTKKRLPQGYAKIKRLASQDLNAYGSVAVAEAVDSYYCSAATQATFKTRFPKTYQAFVGQPSLKTDLGKAWHEKK